MLRRSETGKAQTLADTPTQSFKRRLWRYAPLLIFLIVIYGNSTGAMSASSTGRILRPLLETVFGELTIDQFLFAQLIVRKLAHLTQYAVLGVLAARAFFTSSRSWLQHYWFIAAMILVAACAALDEYHQSMIPSRTGTPYDSLIDIAGGTGALVLIASWRRFRHRRKLRKLPAR